LLVIAIVFCIAVAALGATGLIAPARFLDVVRRITSLEGFYLLAVARIAFGAVLYLVAEESKQPLVVEVLGIVLVASGIVTPFFSHTRYRKVVEWWSAGGDLYVRIWAGCAMLFAILLMYIVLPAVKAVPVVTP
jgi:hypothetical protein